MNEYFVIWVPYKPSLSVCLTGFWALHNSEERNKSQHACSLEHEEQLADTSYAYRVKHGAPVRTAVPAEFRGLPVSTSHANVKDTIKLWTSVQKHSPLELDAESFPDQPV